MVLQILKRNCQLGEDYIVPKDNKNFQWDCKNKLINEKYISFKSTKENQPT